MNTLFRLFVFGVMSIFFSLLLGVAVIAFSRSSHSQKMSMVDVQQVRIERAGR